MGQLTKWIWILIAGMIAPMEMEGQVFHLPARSVYPTGGAYSERFTDGFSFTGNPAVLGSARQFRVALSTERRWMLKELDLARLALSCAAGGGGVGLQFHYTGDLAYHEAGLALAYARDLGPVDLGLKLGVDESQTAGYLPHRDGSVALGLLFHPMEKLSAGLLLNFGVFAAHASRVVEKAAELFEMGIGYELSDRVFFGIRVQKQAGMPMDVFGYLDYCWSRQFFASAGMETGNASPFFRAGWKIDRMSIGLFTAYQPVLGFTPGLLFFWEGKNKEK